MGWFFLLLIIIIACFVLIYNILVKNRNEVKKSFAQIDTELQRRFDLIPNLIETVKSYTLYEKELLENITDARTLYMKATTSSDKIVAEQQLTSYLKSLYAVAENYPDLKASSNFLQLQIDLKDTEDKLSYVRQHYNEAVTKYNTSLEVFPNNLIAPLFGFRPEELFKIGNETKEVPKVHF